MNVRANGGVVNSGCVSVRSGWYVGLARNRRGTTTQRLASHAAEIAIRIPGSLWIIATGGVGLALDAGRGFANPEAAAMLSESEQRELDHIEQQLVAEDPRFALAMRGPHRIGKLPAALFVLFVAWTVATTASVVSGWWLAAAILGAVGVASLITAGVVQIVAWVRRRRRNRSTRAA